MLRLPDRRRCRRPSEPGAEHPGNAPCFNRIDRSTAARAKTRLDFRTSHDASEEHTGESGSTVDWVPSCPAGALLPPIASSNLLAVARAGLSAVVSYILWDEMHKTSRFLISIEAFFDKHAPFIIPQGPV
ncbi:hypothetical protein BV25DRAFT_1302449 [Artomyces pyxidatus]|uniref:Uncharacterized protein n=1 Tax=Artomyces pyxidatus TaxID=48021 RepID=A0ACB8SPL8_9AGAM|nr:hypothetical protein BV25DRAFT_1302449 [Artomyces pyxidatus]